MLSFFVPEIGVEPTRREALAPETSVSTISPLGLAKAGQRYKRFLNYAQFFNTLCKLIEPDQTQIPHPTSAPARSRP